MTAISHVTDFGSVEVQRQEMRLSGLVQTGYAPRSSYFAQSLCFVLDELTTAECL
jgi:hypothetical protein